MLSRVPRGEELLGMAKRVRSAISRLVVGTIAVCIEVSVQRGLESVSFFDDYSIGTARAECRKF